MNDPLKVYVIAGEPSGDLLGSHLMRALKSKSDNIKFYGIGGDRMAGEGLTSLFPYQELAMMGFIEILPYLFNLTARINYTVEDIIAKAPDIVVTIDSPGFCFRVVERLRAHGLKAKFVHYVAPTVWAYKPERAERCAKLFDHMLLLLPFEPPYFEKVGLPCTFIGHPVVNETSSGDGAAFREKYQIAPDTKLFCLLPGSRRGEIMRHMPVFGRTMTLLNAFYRDLAMVVAVPRHVMAFVSPFFEQCPFRTVITANDEDKKNAIAASNLAIAKSGTVALEVGMAHTPMLVSYRVNPVSAHMLRKQCLTKYVNLINIIEQKEIIPEFLQELCNPPLLANAAFQLLESPDRQAQQIQHTKAALDKLRIPGKPLPSEQAAETILRLI